MTTASQHACSFQVDEVERAAKPLPTCKTHESLQALSGAKLEACCDYSDDCVSGVAYHPLLAATHLAFSEHRPLILSPDMIWLTILQGFAQHIKNNAESFRARLVPHQGQKTLLVTHAELVRGSPENPWAEVIHRFSNQLHDELGAFYGALSADFSTTGVNERTACEVALLDAFQPYFQYLAVCICGIPEITLEGTLADWRRLREKIDALQPFELDWWLPEVRAIADQFVRAAAGDVDVEHWRNIYKLRQAYGGELINGWLIRLIPYLEGGERSSSFKERNPFLTGAKNAGVRTHELPSGLSKAPFICQFPPRENVAMEMLGGFVGITQNAQTLALRPKLGWAVRQAASIRQVFVRVAEHAPAPPLPVHEFDACLADKCRQASTLRDSYFDWELAVDFLAFYRSCNGCVLFADDPKRSVRLRPLQDVTVAREVAATPLRVGNHWQCGCWLVFADLADGSQVAIECTTTYPARTYKVIGIHDSLRTMRNERPHIARSFTDFLQMLLGAAGDVTRLRAISPNPAAQDWWSLSDAQLLERAHVLTWPGPPKKLRVYHFPTRVGANADENELEPQALQTALARLREALAFEYRQAIDPPDLPEHLLVACRAGLKVSLHDAQYLRLAAALLDLLDYFEADASKAAACLGIAGAELVRFMDSDARCRAEAERIGAHHRGRGSGGPGA